ncbi:MULTISPECIES: hypothetical protein [unclassified Haladaptatus]|uniref:hypothetical protein n=1 Tax=unclassified Haladaptatus TaxID=2622732 RepID=UPI00209C3587|nr:MULTISPECIES: hypothetical protein [unclassified Haladaptatus]MCO8245878.1 hypothetical protein [Haladaptatus sp. AB643]MCO8254502.1 hypothetical protein [Haladaptatus sp. AB618]
MARERSRDTEGPNRRENHTNDDTVDSITNDGKNIAVNKGEDTSKGTTLTSKGVTNKDDDTVIVGEDGRRVSPGNN